MIKLSFTQKDIDDLRYLRYYHPDPIVMKRCETVYLHCKGLKTGQIRELTGLNEKTIREHLRLFEKGGIEALKHRAPYRPKGDLEDHQLSIEQEFRARPPKSIKEAAERIYQLTGIRRSHCRIEVFLKRLGLKFRKAGGVPAKADLDAQEKFLKEELEPAIDSASKGKLQLYFMDAAHFVWGTGFLVSVWSFVRMFIRTSSGRKRHNVLGAYNAFTRKLSTVVNDSYINSASVCQMLRLLRKLHPGEAITIVLDNAAYQRCKLVQSLAKELGITLMFLPSYSPNLNLIERLWKFVKKQSLNNCYHETFDAFKAAIHSCLDNIDKSHKAQIASLMTLRFQTFKNDQFMAV